MVRAIRGVLITCDAPAKTIIERLHARRQDIIIEVLDETHVVIQESKLSEVKDEIRAVKLSPDLIYFQELRWLIDSPFWLDHKQKGRRVPGPPELRE